VRGEDARKIVAAAKVRQPGVGVRFKTVFLEKGKIGGPRRYADFTFFER
jgi:hypothetical protein